MLWLAGSVMAEPLLLITIGDSITRGVRPDVKLEETFPALVQKALIQQGISIETINAGIGGDTVDAVKKLQAGVIAKKPHFVTLMYGTNDSYVARGQTESRNSLTEYEAALRTLIAALTKANIVPVVMTSPPWAEGAPPDGLKQHPNVRLLPYVTVCRTVAREMQVPLVDHFAHWTVATEKGVKLKDWTSDFCHPNPRGHQELAAVLLQTLAPLAKSLSAQGSQTD